MKLILGIVIGFALATSASIAQELWLDDPAPMNPQVLIPMPVYPPSYPYTYTPQSLPPMTEPHWQSINPC